MKVWLFNIGESLPLDGNGARLMRYGLLADTLTNLGHRVVWWTSTFDHFKKTFRSPYDTTIEINKNYRIKLLHSVPYVKNISFKRWRNHSVIAKKFKEKADEEEKPDIILASVPTIELAYEAMEYATKHKIPIIADLRDMWPDIFLNIFPKGTKNIARFLLSDLFKKMQSICTNSTAIMGISSGYLNWGLSYAKREQRKSDIVFSLSHAPSNFNDKEIINAYKYWEAYGLHINDENSCIISFVGNFGKRFELDTVINAAKKLGKSYKFVLGGLGEQYEKSKKSARNFENIIFPGWLDSYQIATLLKLSSFGLAPYRSTPDFTISIPNKPIEYLSYGVPILSSLKGNLETFIEQKQCGYTYKNNDANSLIEFLKKVTMKPDIIKKMSENSFKAYKESFSSEAIYQQMANYLISMA